MSAMTTDEIRAAIHDNGRLPSGPVRNAQAEALTAAAEVSADPSLFRQALINQIDAYEYSAERTRMLVPFARLLQDYDRDPGAFSSNEAHHLFWRFKWVSGRIVESPEIPLETVSHWLDDMERRYRIAGYSERAVRQAEFYLAHATGDHERAERAVNRWRSADRDSMSDCHACETNSQGWHWAERGEDAKAVEIWQPVLSGDQTCMEEPHRALAHSLMPLLRLGRTTEARDNHLRGYRLARGNESLLRAIGRHVEFCALTGNEARGLEILSEHSALLGPLADVDAQMEFFGGVLVLLGRLRLLGHGDDLSVPYAGTARSVDELYGILRTEALAIARRFDVRNGDSRVSDELVERIEREPLVGVLPLGVRSAALPKTAPVLTAPVPTPSAPVPSGANASAEPSAGPATALAAFAALVERARTARDRGHPAAGALWDEVGVRITARGASADPLVSAEVAEHRALTAARAGAPGAAELMTAVRDSFRALGQAERAALAELRLASVAAQDGAEPDRVRALLAVGLRAAEALNPAHPRRSRRIALAELSAIRLESHLRSVEAAREHDHDPHGHEHGHDHHGPGQAQGQAHGQEELTAELAAFLDSYRDGMPDVAAEAEEMLGRIALSRGDTERALPLLAASAERSVTAGFPWQAVDALVLRAGVLAQLGRPEEAEEAARAALAHSSDLTDAEEQGVVRLTLADILLRRRDAEEEAAEQALAATHWFDQAGLSGDGGAQARLLLARAYARADRTADAAEVLRSALPDLLEHGEGQAVAAREFLGNLLGELGESREAAEQFLLAAELTKDWEDPGPQANFAQAAADCLSTAGLVREAVAAYERALELRRSTGGDVIAEVRILRALAWLGVREEYSDDTVAAARTRMDEAAGALAPALETDPKDPEPRAELARTWQQLAQLLDQRVTDGEDTEGGAGHAGNALGAAVVEALRLEEILLLERAAGVYAELGPEYLRDRFQCLNNAAWTDQELGRPRAGAARISALIEEVRALPEGAAPEWLLSNAERIVERLLSEAS
ncbi:tetratricopeptide repeat protein [Streptomyces sp. NPDC088097]|uniref:tetratricopeptide repeat protein n=1 Tax=Streptomyces sp. NPDC088097 TaxID=3365823 RepID=UPI00381EC633